MKLKFALFLFAAAFLALGPARASAASFFTLPSGGRFEVGESFDLEIRIDSEGQAFNAAQATVHFPKDILEAKSVSTSGSVFNFWLEGPVLSNDNGTVSFIGGTTSGILSSSARILAVSFRVKGSGSGQITLDNTAITASDGTGSNIFSSAKGAAIIAGSAALPPAPAPAPGESAPPPAGGTAPPAPAPVIKVPIPPPTQIIRTPVAARKLPVTPEVIVTLYNNQEKWYNLTLDFLAQWRLPEDISDIATAINQNPNFVPQSSEGLFDAKMFEALTDGIWYLHVRFKNNVGWGPVAHYKIAIDTVPPALFGIEKQEKEATDNPAPTFTFNTGDSLSGLKEFTARLDDTEAVDASEGRFTASPQPPGKHTIYVRAGDHAGNAREVTLDFEILPIKAPTAFLKEYFAGDEALGVFGAATPEFDILVDLSDSAGKSISSSVVKVGPDGYWSAKIDQPLSKGKFKIAAVSRDERGARSLPVELELTVRERPLFTFAGIGITKIWLLYIIIAVLLGGFATGWRVQMLQGAQRKRKVTIAARDVNVVFGLIKKDVEAVLEKQQGGIDETEFEEIKFLLQRLNTNLDKLRKYLSQNIEEIDD